jgi:hypothetical protein
VGATYQQFDNGFMTWRSDSGDIWVFLNDGRVFSYPLRVYGGLSGDARYTGVSIPAGRTLPVLGFKKVYDNFRDVREGVGWAVGGERGYTMQLQPVADGFAITLPASRAIHIHNNGVWEYDSSSVISISPPTTIPPSSAPSTLYPPIVVVTPQFPLLPGQFSTGATFQPFENGFMVWRADNGEIRVYVGGYVTGEIGELTVYPISQYASLQARQYQPPDGRWFPEFGFGKVWSSIPGVRERLGWAVGGEQGFTMIVQNANGEENFSLPDGRSVVCGRGQGNACAISPYPGSTRDELPTIQPASSPSPTSNTIVFTANPSIVYPPDDRTTLMWDAGNVAAAGTSVEIEWINAQGETESRRSLPLAGTMTFQLSAVTIPNTHIYFHLFVNDSAGQRIPTLDGSGYIGSTLMVTVWLSPDMQIVSFSATPNPAARGGQVTLTWDVQSPHTFRVFISRLDINGQFTNSPEIPSPFPASGSVTIVIPPDYMTSVSYVLTAVDGRGLSVTSSPLIVSIQ